MIRFDTAPLRAAMALALFVWLVGCDERDPPKKSNELLEQIKQETALMANPDQAGPELEQRLQAKVSAADGILFVSDPILRGVSVLPATTPWVMRCGLTGLSITFGSAVSGGEGNVENDVELSLSTGNIDQKNCYVLGRRVGKRLLSLLLHDQPLSSVR
jgi:hypothetical protein